MSSKAVELVQRAERGERVAKIRAALGMTGDDFAKELTAIAKSFDVQARYDRAKVSRMESGSRKLTVEEAALIAMMDPERREIGWLVFGDVSKAAGKHKYARVTTARALAAK